MSVPDDIRSRMAVIEARVEAFGDEVRRTRDRLHDIENDRHALGLLAQRVDTLAHEQGQTNQKLDRLSDNMESVAQRAAREAVRMAFDEWEDEREETALKTWANRFALMAVGIAMGGFVLAVIQTLTAGR